MSFQIILITKVLMFFIILLLELVSDQMAQVLAQQANHIQHAQSDEEYYHFLIKSGPYFKKPGQLTEQARKNQKESILVLDFFKIPFEQLIVIKGSLLKGNQKIFDEKQLLKYLGPQLSKYIKQIFESIVGVTYYNFVKNDQKEAEREKEKDIKRKEEQKNKQENERELNFKKYICLNLFLNIFSFLESLNTRLKLTFKQSGPQNQLIWKKVLTSIVQIELKQVAKLFNKKFLQGNPDVDNRIVDKMKDGFLIIDRKDNQQNDFFILEGIKYSQNHEVAGQSDRSFKLILNVIKRIQENSKQAINTDFQAFCKIISASRRSSKNIIFKDLEKLTLFEEQTPFIKIDRKIKTQSAFKITSYTTKKEFQDLITKADFDQLKKMAPFQRIITKFIQNLNELIQESKRYFKQRIYPYKDINNNLVYPDSVINDELMKGIQLIKENKKLAQIREKLFLAQVQCIFNQKLLSYSSLLARQVEISAKILKHLMIQSLNYLEKMIDLIIKAGNIKIKRKYQLAEGQVERQEQYNINLIHLKIGDLFRAKISCEPEEFTSILKFLYEKEKPYQDSNFNEQNVFRIIKISDKIERPERGVLINYLFRGKLVCQLQINTVEQTDTQSKLYEYCHMIYELNRGQFGVISQIATIIAANYQHSFYKLPHLYQRKKIQQQAQKKNTGQVNQLSNIQVQNFQKQLGQILKQKSLIYQKTKAQWLEVKLKDKIQLPDKSARLQVIRDILLKKKLESEIVPQFVRYLYSSQQIPRNQGPLMKQFISPINKFISLQYLVLTNNKISSINWLSPILISRNLKELVVRQNLLTDLGQISKYSSQSLIKIDLSYNRLGYNISNGLNKGEIDPSGQQVKDKGPYKSKNLTKDASNLFQIAMFPCLRYLLLKNNSLKSFTTVLETLTESETDYQQILLKYPLQMIDLSENLLQNLVIYRTKSLSLKIQDNKQDANVHIGRRCIQLSKFNCSEYKQFSEVKIKGNIKN